MDLSLDLSAVVEEESFNEPAESNTHQCSECPYTSKFKHNVTRHEKLHKTTCTAPKSITPMKVATEFCFPFRSRLSASPVPYTVQV